ncbi:hypothetical protein PRVXH_002395 [Proteinivorax hydrogeniformans]|uniref:Uncharacterized protein n=1 Tax=Proteinivorax hydrogeniformans TaxID=1826727 RepID=A0AAU8HST3_9FIRM
MVTKRLPAFLLLIGTGVLLMYRSVVTWEDNGIFLTLLAVVGILYAIGVYHHVQEIEMMSRSGNMDKRIQMILLAVCGTFLAFFLGADPDILEAPALGLNPMVGSGIVGILAAQFLPKDLAVVAYTAAFAGMSCATVLSNYSMVLLAGILVGVIFIKVQPIYNGYGGKLGTIAALSVLITTMIFSML